VKVKEARNTFRYWRSFQTSADLEEARRVKKSLEDFFAERASLGWPLDRFKSWEKVSTRSYWDADHIVPVHQGGGECGLDNYRTLCYRCHKFRHSRKDLKTSG
jgi:5-methylcytosine-specific restriction endonuclease McrA